MPKLPNLLCYCGRRRFIANCSFPHLAFGVYLAIRQLGLARRLRLTSSAYLVNPSFIVGGRRMTPSQEDCIIDKTNTAYGMNAILVSRGLACNKSALTLIKIEDFCSEFRNCITLEMLWWAKPQQIRIKTLLGPMTMISSNSLPASTPRDLQLGCCWLSCIRLPTSAMLLAGGMRNMQRGFKLNKNNFQWQQLKLAHRIRAWVFALARCLRLLLITNASRQAGKGELITSVCVY